MNNSTDMKKCRISLKAKAKINLFLDVLSRRPDGYHNIDSIMHTVSLCDLVTVTAEPVPDGSEDDTINLVCSDPSIPGGPKNLAFKAAERFISSFAVKNHRIGIELEKHIPSAAGLGGGSSDAAAVLRGLGEIFGTDKEKLYPIAAGIGADVPFCIMEGCARATGIGEILTPLGRMPDCEILIACGGEGISTPAAYAALDSALLIGDAEKRHGDVTAAINALSQDVTRLCGSMYNAFQDMTFSAHPVSKLIYETLRFYGADGAMLSGSGPSVFGIFKNPDKTASAEAQLKELGIPCFITKPS